MKDVNSDALFDIIQTPYLCFGLLNTNSLSSANFVGYVVGFLTVLVNTLAAPPPCRLVIL
jgi:hypothetical protein